MSASGARCAPTCTRPLSTPHRPQGRCGFFRQRRTNRLYSEHTAAYAVRTHVALEVIVMATSFLVDSPRCGHKTEIRAARSGKTIGIEIVSTCPRVKAYAEVLSEVALKDVAKPILSNPVYTSASAAVGPECVVPCAVVSAVWAEAGMVARSLLIRYPNTGFTYTGGCD